MIIGSALVHNGSDVPKLVSSEVETSLRHRIQSGEWRHAGRLPNERELATQYGVARNTVRAAIDRIAADGSLVREVGRGTFLKPAPGIDFGAVMHKLVGVSPIDMMAVRHILEPRAAALAATNASASDLEAIAAAHAEAVAAIDAETFEQWDGEFHQRIFAGSRVELLNYLHEILLLIRNQDLWLQIKRRSFSEERRLAYCAEHAAIVQALLRRDAEAAEATARAHLESVARNLFASGGTVRAVL